MTANIVKGMQAAPVPRITITDSVSSSTRK